MNTNPVIEMDNKISMRIRVWFNNWKVRKTGRALKDLRNAFEKDDGFYEVWHANISCRLQDDSNMSRKKANSQAHKLMSFLFNVKGVRR